MPTALPGSQDCTPCGTTRLAVLLPLTSRGGLGRLCEGLDRFLKSLARTTATSLAPSDPSWVFSFHVGIDQDDNGLNPESQGSLPLKALFAEHLSSLEWTLAVHKFDLPPGSICAIWRGLAKAALRDGSEYFVLLGDDILLKTPSWPSIIRNRFHAIQESTGLPFGFGCVAFRDETFPGFPTFPVLHRRHFDVFEGDVFPSDFINQDADPFLFQIYRPWNASVIASDAILTNQIGGPGDARYQKKHVPWNRELLRAARGRAATWLESTMVPVRPCITLDVVVPCYRANSRLLDGILSLPVPPQVSTMFIIVFDHPESADSVHLFRELEERHANNPMVRLRLQPSNLGASAARNRGLDESAADWVLFLDDDVVPEPDILERYADAIQSRPHAAGFVGASLLPPPATSTQAAVHIANISYFWTIARGLPEETELPWGVTANLLVRRELGARVRFQTSFPKTGGGEDIDFCLRVRALHATEDRSGQGWVAAPLAVVHHPWWDEGRCRYNHFFGWSRGDSQLIDLFRATHTYLNLPDLAETITLVAVVWLVQALFLAALSLGILPIEGTWARHLAQFTNPWAITLAPLVAASCVLADVLYEASSWFISGALARPLPELEGVTWSVRVVGLFEGLVIRAWSQFGRLWGHWERGRFWANFCRRFKWFGAMWPGHVQAERKREATVWLVRLGVSGIAIFLRSQMQ
ncbi:MAG: glycosyltransferase [Verrucomicrobiota bacterium]